MTPWELIQEGRKYFNAKEFDKASTKFEEALQLDPNYAFGYFWKAKILEKMLETKKNTADDNLNNNSVVPKKEQILSLLNIAIQFDPKFLSAYYLRGFIHYDLKQFDKAIDDLNVADSLLPTLDPTYRFGLRNDGIYFKRGLARHELLLKNLEEGHELKEFELDNILNDLLSFISINAELPADQKFEEKEELTYKAYYHRVCSWVHRKKGNYQKALEEYCLAIDIYEKNKDVRIYLGTFAHCYERRAELYTELKDYAKALEDYAKAFEFESSDRELKQKVKHTFDLFMQSKTKADKKDIFNTVKNLPHTAGNLLLKGMYYGRGEAGRIIWEKTGLFKTSENAGTAGKIRKELKERKVVVNESKRNIKLENADKQLNVTVSNNTSTTFGNPINYKKSTRKVPDYARESRIFGL